MICLGYEFFGCFFAGSVGLVVLALAGRYMPAQWRGGALVLVVILGAAQRIAGDPAHVAFEWAVPGAPAIATLAVATFAIVGSLGLCGVGAMVAADGRAVEWGLVGRPVGRQIAVGVLVGLAMALSFGARVFTRQVGTSLAGSWVPWMWVCYAVVGWPWQEEVVFRGLGLPALTRLLRRAEVANVVQALVFSALHLSLEASKWLEPGGTAYWMGRGAVMFCLGWICGHVRLRYGGIWAPYAVHATYNSVLSVSRLAG